MVNTQGFLTELLNTQQTFIHAIEQQEAGPSFYQDAWSYAPRGGGVTAVLEHGHLFESAAINFSHVSGDTLPKTASQMRPELAGYQFEAMGISLIFHPHNPFVPTVHFNVRLFHAHQAENSVWWFGGGMDLTPYYGFEEDARHFHVTIRDALHPHDPTLYPRFKKQCDDYFYLKHRQEARGIGGIFFDDFDVHQDFDASHRVVSAVISALLPAYLPIVEKRCTTPYTEEHKAFQQYRRGRYVEFNLLYDRGTLFGIQSGGRTESILCSLPRVVRWRYNWSPTPGTPEHRLYTDFLIPRDWANLPHRQEPDQ